MARSKSGRNADANDDAIALSAMLRPTPAPRPVLTPSPYLVLQDERQYTPLRLLQPRGPGGAPARIRERRTGTSRAVLQFASPAAVDICRKRHARREVIFAKGKSGKGSRNPIRKMREFSKVKCK